MRPRGRGLNSPTALALRLQAGSIIGWCIGGLARGLLAGSLGSAIAAADASQQQHHRCAARHPPDPGGIADPAHDFGRCSRSSGSWRPRADCRLVLRLRQEEAGGTAELLLAAPVSRCIRLAQATCAGRGVGSAGPDPDRVGAWASLAAVGDTSVDGQAVWETAAAQLPAALIYLAVPALVFVLWPAATIAGGWALLGAGVVLGIFGGLVGLDRSIRDLSPFTHTPVPSGTTTDWSGAWWMLAIAVLAVAVAMVGMRRRETGTA